MQFASKLWNQLVESLEDKLQTRQLHTDLSMFGGRLEQLEKQMHETHSALENQLNTNHQQNTQGLQSVQEYLGQLSLISHTGASTCQSEIRSLCDFIIGLRGEMQLEMRRLRLGPVPAAESGYAVAKYLDLLEGVLTGTVTRDSAQSSNGEQPFDPLRRSLGRDWPTSAVTMIGDTRMRNLRNLLELALRNKIEGDFIETGVWRGGACIYAKAVFEAYGQTERRVFVADSFRGLPPPNEIEFPQDTGDTHHFYSELAISRDAVAANFSRFGLLDERVVFIEGWFSETLAVAPVDKLCMLRLDGDLYESTIVALNSLYDKVSKGGYVVVDDYLLPTCEQAVNDFRVKRGITTPMQPVDGAAVWWQVE